MKDFSSRANTFSSVLMNCTIALLFVIFFVSYMTPIKPIAGDLKITWMSPGNGFRVVRLIPNIDLTPQFVFNIKQIFLYVVAKSNGKEEMLWSKIVKNGGNYVFKELVQSTYPLDPSGKIEFELRGSIFPYTGQLIDVSYGSVPY